eukprot:3337602-Pleurochrysis_carterae.AAC.1
MAAAREYMAGAEGAMGANGTTADDEDVMALDFTAQPPIAPSTLRVTQIEVAGMCCQSEVKLIDTKL